MNLEQRIREQFLSGVPIREQAAVLLPKPIERAVHAMVDCIRRRGKILACGNGGSAGDCQHFAAEMVGRFEAERPGMPAIALTTDSSILTAVGNDYAYDQVFVRQVQALGSEGDILLAISTSGNSANVIEAIQTAHLIGMRVIALTGRDGGKMAKLLKESDIELRVPADRTTRIQEIHLVIIHSLCDGIDNIFLK